MFLKQKKFSVSFKRQFPVSLQSGALKFYEDLTYNCFHVLKFQFEKKVSVRHNLEVSVYDNQF